MCTIHTVNSKDLIRQLERAGWGNSEKPPTIASKMR